MAIPVSLFALGLVVAAVLGFVGGWILASKPRERGDGEAGDFDANVVKPETRAEIDPLVAAWNESPPERVIMYLRLDAVENWRRTHGQRAIEHFVQEMVTVVTDMLPTGGHVVRREAEAIAICTGDRRLAAQISDVLRNHRFAHLDGQEALVSAGMGVVEESDASLEVHMQRALAAVSEATRRVRGGFAIWEPGGVRHVRPVEVLT